MSRTPRVIDGNPATFDPNGVGVLPGDVVVDFSGAVPGVSAVERSAPLVNVLVPLAPASSVASADAISVSAVGVGAGTLSLQFTVTNNGLPVLDRGMTVGIQMALPGTFTDTAGAVLMNTTAVNAMVTATTDAAGKVSFLLTGTIGAAVQWIASSLGRSGVTVSGSSTIQP